MSQHTGKHQPVCRATRIRIMVTLGRSFTRAQLASVIDLLLGLPDDDAVDLARRAGFDEGYRARESEENAAYPPSPVFSYGEWVSTAERKAAREHALRPGPRPGDCPGMGAEAVERLRAEKARQDAVAAQRQGAA